MLELRPCCEHCKTDLATNATNAMICAFECTFCVDCVEQVLHNVCPNCGGGFEKSDKSFKHTALRETKEELGIRKKDIKIIGQLDTYVAPIGAIIEPFVGIIKNKAIDNMLIDKNEVEKTILIPLKFLKENPPQEYKLKYEVHPYSIDKNGKKDIHFPVEELGLPKAYHNPWAHKSHKVWVYKYDNEVIWGLTAVIINDLLKKY